MRLRSARKSGNLAASAPRISAIVLTRDSAVRLAEVLSALAWCDEVVALDTGSHDDTIDIASQWPNVSVHRLDGPFPGFGEARRRATQLARNDWILSIDSDEVVSAELTEELRRLNFCPQTIYRLPFENYYNGRLITSCGWGGEHHERLYHRRTTGFCSSKVHERVQSSGLRVKTLDHPVRHYSYSSADDFLRKMHAYSALFASQHMGRKSSSPGKAISRGLWTFVKSYVVQRGFLQGYEGFTISSYKAQTAFWKYLMLYEANRQA